VRPARLAAIFLVADEERFLVEHRALDARPGAHIDADLFARDAAKEIGRQGEEADEEIGGRRRVEGQELARQRRRVGKIEDPGAARRQRDQNPGQVLSRLARQLAHAPGRLVEADAFGAVAFEEAFDMDEEVGPDRLRAGITAPDAAGDARHEKEAESRENEEARDVVEFLRPDFEEEEIETPRGKIEQHRLVGKVRSPVPAQPGRHVIDRQGESHH